MTQENANTTRDSKNPIRMHGIIRHLCINLNDKDMKVLLVLLSSIIFLGCATLGDSSSHVPVVYNDSDINFSNYFSEYRIVRFDSSIPDAYIRSMKRVLFLPERIVVFDENDNKILLFDEEGRFLKSSKSIVGRAKGEYISLSDVSLDIENEQIYALCDRPNKIMVFDKDLKCLFEKELKVDPLEIAVDGSFLYCYCYNSQNLSERTLIRFDKNKLDEEGSTLQSISSAIPGVGTFGCSLTLNRGVDFCIPFSNCISHIKNGIISDSRHLDFGDKWFSYEQSENLQPRTFIEKNHDNIWCIKNICSSDSVTFFTTNRPNIFIYERNKNICNCYRRAHNDILPFNSVFVTPVQGRDGYVAYMIPPSSILAVKKDKKVIFDMYRKRFHSSLSNELSHFIDEYGQEDNPWLILYKLK